WFIRWFSKEQKREPLNRKAAEREAVARHLLNKRVAFGKGASPSLKTPSKKRGKPSSGVISLLERRQKNRRTDT
ncbi:MAG: hypothetical protein AB2404_14570, partial [Planifilum fimeticola]